MGEMIKHARLARAMGGLFVFGAAIFATAAAQAADSSNADFLQRWAITPKLVRQDARRTYEARVFERLVSTREGAFAVGNVTYMKFPRTDSESLEAAAERVRAAMGFAKWNRRHVRGAQVYEAEWTPVKRWVRLYLKDEGPSISMSVALFRTAWAESVAVESELLQRQLAGVTEEQRPWLLKALAWADRNIGIPSAYAQALGCGPCAAGDVVCAMNLTSCNEGALVGQMQQFNNNMGSFNNTIGNTNAQLGAANQNWGASNTQLGIANQNWASTNQQLAAANQQAALANQNWAASNAEIHRTNQLLAQALKPENAFIFAAAGAAGAATGAIAVGLAVDAIAAGGSALWEAITHEKEDAHILERFQQAREIWEKTTTAAADLEHAIDSLLYLKDLSRTLGMSREALARLGDLVAQKQAELENARQQLLAATRDHDANCIQQYSHDVAQLTEFTEVLGRLNGRLRDASSDAALCTDLKNDLSKLLQAEGALQRARAAILGGHEVWQRKWNEENNAAVADLQRARGDARRINLEAIRMANEHKERALAEQDALRDREIDRCESRKAGFFGQIPVIGIIRGAWSSPCSREFEASYQGARYRQRTDEIRVAYAQQLRDSGVEYNSAMQRADDTYFHTPTMVGELKGYDMWFEQVRGEQACLENRAACTPNVNGMMTRFQALASKGQRIDQVCAAH